MLAETVYERAERSYLDRRLAGIGLFPGVTCAFFLVIYYGTSFEVTPFTIFMPWLFKRRTIPSPDSDLKSGASPDEILFDSVRSATRLATRMERRTNTHLILGVTMGLLGVSVWLFAQTFGLFGVPRANNDRDNQIRAVNVDRVEGLLAMAEREMLTARDASSGANKDKAFASYEQGIAQRKIDDAIGQMRVDVNQVISKTVQKDSVGTILSRDFVSLLLRLTMLVLSRY